MAFALNSPAFADGETIPARHTRDGENLSPPLTWTDPPPGTQSIVLVAEDPDAPSGLFTHWILYDISPSRRELTEGQSVPFLGTAGQNDFGGIGYGGPAPPPGHGPHRYFFRLSALDIPSLGLEAGAARAAVDRAMEGHVLETAQVMGRYERRRG